MISEYSRQQKEKLMVEQLAYLEMEVQYVSTATRSLAKSTRKVLQYLRKRDKDKVLKS